MEEKNFHGQLRELMDEYVQKVYGCTKKFPREEIFGVTSQLRRATLSVVLNYIEGYARQRKEVLRNFIEISYGSLKESAYLISFSYTQRYVNEAEHAELTALGDRIGKMLWGILTGLKKK
ncbi:MAG: four helix bundle protein [Candidatus Taylorbacteria bacterium CG11_big_fil_rev_8_21_14_0_20_46_11]|uniref:Four helix bundle protein n=1 Tax=Candidatus Taylorbacteria bacterium CG11_big_fil_rev_8_21_14_0_20_46_11 TaxID=1975025 RepID=A0A2H0KBU3_9BACT|nr:MAG: four helix bundle protein [Candidatus Taylorbacteria bacterium CG11_big_fil_rev_8_21_14_0_20_46_11]